MCVLQHLVFIKSQIIVRPFVAKPGRNANVTISYPRASAQAWRWLFRDLTERRIKGKRRKWRKRMMMLDELKDGKSYLLGGKVHGAAFVSCGRVVFMELPSCRRVPSCRVHGAAFVSCRRVPSCSWSCLRIFVKQWTYFLDNNIGLYFTSRQERQNFPTFSDTVCKTQVTLFLG